MKRIPTHRDKTSKIALLITIGIALLSFGFGFQATAHADIRIDAELETSALKDGQILYSVHPGTTQTLQLKNGIVKMTTSQETDKTVHIHTEIYALNSPGEKPMYNSTFLTNLDKDAELREMHQDGSLYYRLKIIPRSLQKN